MGHAAHTTPYSFATVWTTRPVERGAGLEPATACFEGRGLRVKGISVPAIDPAGMCSRAWPSDKQVYGSKNEPDSCSGSHMAMWRQGHDLKPSVRWVSENPSQSPLDWRHSRPCSRAERRTSSPGVGHGCKPVDLPHVAPRWTAPRPPPSPRLRVPAQIVGAHHGAEIGTMAAVVPSHARRRRRAGRGRSTGGFKARVRGFRCVNRSPPRH